MLWLDLETRSQCDLRASGLARYARHESTDVICMSYAFNDDPVTTWFAEDEPFPSEVSSYLASGGKIVAHNAAFERHMFEYVLQIPVELTQWLCSSAWAMAHGLPSSLKDLCIAMELPIQKQTEGTRLIREYSCPGFLHHWKPGDKQLMQDYCEMDVLTMRMACTHMSPLPPEMWRQYHITEDINDYGVPVDISFANAALEYSEEIRNDVNEQLQKLTAGLVTKHTDRKNRDLWFKENFSEDDLSLITVKEKIKFDKEHRAILLRTPDVDERLQKYAELIEAAGGSTISKYKSMVDTHVSGRVHGSLIWSGAGSTGRFSSRGLQLQNFKRNVMSNPDETINEVLSGAPVEKPADTLARLVRSAITSSHGLTYSDYSQIEARVLPWLSADPLANHLLKIFEQGLDVYSETAKLSPVFQQMWDPRQAAKQGVLACGFGGGKNAVHNMAKAYGMRLTDDQAQSIVDAWRDANKWAKPFWYGLTRAAENAIRSPGQIFECGRLRFMYTYPDWLWMELPSGRCLAYCQPRYELDQAPWEDEPSNKLTVLWGSGKRKANEPWPRRPLTHIILAENATQATAADLMREAIVRGYDAGLDILFSVHDELVCEGFCKDKLHEVMVTPPDWSKGLPIDADTTESYRYGK